MIPLIPIVHIANSTVCSKTTICNKQYSSTLPTILYQHLSFSSLTIIQDIYIKSTGSFAPISSSIEYTKHQLPDFSYFGRSGHLASSGLSHGEVNIDIIGVHCSSPLTDENYNQITDRHLEVVLFICFRHRSRPFARALARNIQERTAVSNLEM